MPKIEMITLERLLEMQANDEDFVLIDTLPEESYNEGHLAGAVSMPSNAVAREAENKLSKDKTVVTYCAGYTCEASTVAARKLLNLGYKRVLDFKAGKKGWVDANFNLEK